MSFSFKFGKYRDMNAVYFVGYNLEALFYDAVKGVHYSRELIFRYYCDHIDHGIVVPNAIQLFVSHEIGKVLGKKQTPAQMFKPLGQKGKTTKAELCLVLDAVYYSRTALRKKGETVFTKASDLLNYYGTHIEADRVEQIYRELAKPRSERINKVSAILCQHYSHRSLEEKESLFTELQYIYKDKSKLT